MSAGRQGEIGGFSNITGSGVTSCKMQASQVRYRKMYGRWKKRIDSEYEEHKRRKQKVPWTYEEYERLMKRMMPNSNEFVSELDSERKEWENVWVDRWFAFTYVGDSLGYFVTRKMRDSDMLRAVSGIPDILKDLSMDGKDVNKLCYSANMGALSGPEILKAIGNLLMSRAATGIEMAMFRDEPTRLATRAVDSEGRPYTEHGNTVSHEVEGEHYFAHVPDEYIATRLSRFKKYHVFSFGNDEGPRFFARSLNCIMLHLNGLRIRDESREDLQAAHMEIWACYPPVIIAGLRTVRKEKDAFVITDEVMTAIVSPGNFEILGDAAELPENQHLAWGLFQEIMVIIHLAFGKLKYPEVIANMQARSRSMGYESGPERTFDRRQNVPSTGRDTVEHLG